MTTVPQIHTVPHHRPTVRETLINMPVCIPAGAGLVILSITVTLTFFSYAPERWLYLAISDAFLAACLGVQILICRLTRTATSIVTPSILPLTTTPTGAHACTPNHPAVLIDQAIEAETRGIGRPEIHFIRDYAEVDQLCLDTPRMLIVLRELIRNAIEALQDRLEGPDRVLLVRVNATPFIDGVRLRVEVNDNGIGIAPQNLSRLFAPGFTTRPDHAGHGLNDAHQAAREMHATLTVASAGEDLGATFTLEVPTHYADAV